MEKIKAFISYQRRKDEVLQAWLEIALTECSVDTLCDVNEIIPGSDYRKKISNMIHECDCVIVPDTSISSIEVICELTIAHERNKTFLLLKKEHSKEKIPPCLYFLQTTQNIEYSNLEHLKQNIKKFFADKEKNHFASLPFELIEISETIKSIINFPNFASHLIKNILGEALNEIRSIQSGKYRINVGSEKNFLIRAQPLFGNAIAIYAFSLDYISTFWTNRKNILLAENYIKNQPENTMRLFVFSSPSEANKYKKILQASHNSYGRKGGVFICSLSSYIALLEKMLPKQVEGLKEHDFAILKYNYHGRDHYVEAQFDESELKFQTLSLPFQNPNYNSVIEFFNELQQLGLTDYYQNDNKIKIKRWNPDCLDKKHIWKEELQNLFPENIGGSIYHFVYFKNLGLNKEELLFKLKNELVNQKVRFGIQDIWLGRKSEVSDVHDVLFQAPLKVTQDYDFVLVLTFKNYDDLISYYGHDRHSVIRKELYRKMNGALEKLLNIFDRVSEKLSKNGLKKRVMWKSG